MHCSRGNPGPKGSRRQPDGWFGRLQAAAHPLRSARQGRRTSLALVEELLRLDVPPQFVPLSHDCSARLAASLRRQPPPPPPSQRQHQPAATIRPSRPCLSDSGPS